MADQTTPTDPTTADVNPDGAGAPEPPARPRRRRAASRPAGPPAPVTAPDDEPVAASLEEPAAPPADEPAPPPRARRSRKKAAPSEPPPPPPEPMGSETPPLPDDAAAPLVDGAAEAAAPIVADAAGAATGDEPQPRPRRTRKSRAAAPPSAAAEPVLDAPGEAAESRLDAAPDEPSATEAPEPLAEPVVAEPRTGRKAVPPRVVLFQAPVVDIPLPVAEVDATPEVDLDAEDQPAFETDSEGGEDRSRRRRRRGGRGRRSRGVGAEAELAEDAPAEDAQDGAPRSAADGSAPAAGEDTDASEAAGADASGSGASEGTGGTRRRRRRRRGSGAGDVELSPDDPPATVVRVREPRKRADRRPEDDEVQSLRGSTRLEAKKQRRREGRDQGRRRPPVLTESEFLARRESVERVMVVRERDSRTQIAVLEDGVLVEHYVSRDTGTAMLGNVYLGRVQNVLPSMEAAFIDIGKGRNGVLYAGEVNWDAAGMEGQPRRIELALKSGDPVLVQVTKDPIGAKGARLTSQVSLPGRYLVYVPDGSMTGISRKLPENERSRLKAALRAVVPDEAGVIVRTAAEGASEEELRRDVTRLQDQWDDIVAASKTASAPALLHGEPDLTVRVIRDLFNEDFASLVVSGEDAARTVEDYLGQVAPELADRVTRWTGADEIFAAHRVDEQLLKALDRKVYLPSGGSLVIDRTEAMVVVDVNTGKFVGKGGNLEETVTKNNLEAAEEIVRQLRLRDLGGIIVIDFIDMVLESNRDLVLRRLLESLGRDRTKHQVAEVTSLGLVQMTRKRVGEGLLEAFSETCEHCKGRGVMLHAELLDPSARRSGREPALAPVAAIAEAIHASARDSVRAEADSAVADISAALEVPAADVPALDVPELDGPALDVPELDGPALYVPELDGPALYVPEVDGAAASTPGPDGLTVDGEQVAVEPTARPRRRRATRQAGTPVAAGTE